MRARLLSCALLLAAASVGAVETTTWPPPPEVLARMHDLQAMIADGSKSKEERAAARQELQRLMKSPAGAARKEDDAKKPARAAIDPFPSVAKEMAGRDPRLVIEPPPTARLEVIPDAPPRRPTIDPASGRVLVPTSPGAAVDPRTGALLHETPSGYVDPRTGRLVPK
jgi:hypothetical protein